MVHTPLRNKQCRREVPAASCGSSLQALSALPSRATAAQWSPLHCSMCACATGQPRQQLRTASMGPRTQPACSAEDPSSRAWHCLEASCAPAGHAQDAPGHAWLPRSTCLPACRPRPAQRLLQPPSLCQPVCTRLSCAAPPARKPSTWAPPPSGSARARSRCPRCLAACAQEGSPACSCLGASTTCWRDAETVHSKTARQQSARTAAQTSQQQGLGCCQRKGLAEAHSAHLRSDLWKAPAASSRSPRLSRPRPRLCQACNCRQ